MTGRTPTFVSFKSEEVVVNRNLDKMRKSLFGTGSDKRTPSMRPRISYEEMTRITNEDMTLKNRGSGGSVRKSYLPHQDNDKPGTSSVNNNKRTSAEGMFKVSLTGASRYSPMHSRVRGTPKQPSTDANNNLQPNLNRLSIESLRRSSIGSRSSSIGGRSVNKETRQLSDPKFKSHCIDKIMEFLTHNGYEKPITRRNLLTPSNNDFKDIFNFIYCRLDDSYQLPTKFEDEIPKLLRNIKYPIPMKKSFFITVGSPHTYISVLDMLTWLIDIVNIYCNVDPVSLAFPVDFEDELNKLKVRFDAMVSCINCDDIQLELDKYRCILEKHEKVSTDDIENIQNEKALLDEELKNLAIDPERLQKLQLQYQQIIEDKDKLDAYVHNLKEIISKKNEMSSVLAVELSQLKDELKGISREIQYLTKLKEEQGLNTVELVHFKNHATDGAALVTQLQSEGRELDSQIWSLEMKLDNAKTILQEFIHSYNTDIQQLELGNAFKVSPLGVAENLHQWENQILNSLRSLKKCATHNVLKAQNNAHSVEKEKCPIDEKLQDKRDHFKALELKLKRLEDSLKSIKYGIAQEEQELKEECERLQKQITEAKQVRKGSLALKQCELEKRKRELEAAKTRGLARKEEGTNFLVNVCERSREHMEFVSQEIIKNKLIIENIVGGYDENI